MGDDDARDLAERDAGIRGRALQERKKSLISAVD
jgi:hypothetical protein